MVTITPDAAPLLDMISTNAKRVCEYEYISSDGVRRCKKCNEPTTAECSVQLTDGTTANFTRRVICRCKKEKKTAELEMIQALNMQHARDRAFEKFGLKYSQCDFTTDDRKNISLTKKIHSYVDNFDKYYDNGQGLILYGNVGVGKTYAAAIIVNELLKKKNLKNGQFYKCYITKLEAIKRDILEKKYSDNQVLAALINKDLLVIDDFGTQNDTNFALELMQNVIDIRYNNCKPTIITTNINFNNMQGYIDPKQRLAYERIRSRLCEMCKIIECEGRDRRIYASG